MRFDKWWNKVDLKNYYGPEGELDLAFLAETAWDLAFELGEMANNEAAYDDGYNQGHHDALLEVDLKDIKEEAFKDGHSQGHAAGMKASLRELL